MDNKEIQKKHFSKQLLILLLIPLFFVSLIFIPQFRKALKRVFAGTPRVEHRLRVLTTGTPTWDGVSWDLVPNSASQGQDASPNDMVVRAQDTIVYGLEQSINEGEAENVVSRAVLSAGQKWLGLPVQCKTEGVVPVSSISGDGRTLVCNTGNHARGSEILISATAVVNRAKNSDEVWVSTTVEADDVPVSEELVSEHVVVTALFSIDVENEIEVVHKQWGVGLAQDGVTYGQFVKNHITVRLGKGSELPAGNSQNLTFSINYANYEHPTIPAEDWLLYDWGGNIPCSLAGGGSGGNISCTKSGNNVIVTLTNMNYLLAQEPKSILYKFTISSWIPSANAQNANSSHTLAYTTNVQFTPIPSSVTGIPSNITGVESNLLNNRQDGQHLWIAPGSHCSWVTTDVGGCGGEKHGTATTTAGLIWKEGMPWMLHNVHQDTKFSPMLNKNRTFCMKVDKRYFDYVTPRYMYVRGSSYWATYTPTDIPYTLEYSTTPIPLNDTALQSQKCDNSMTWSETAPADSTAITAIRVRYVPTVDDPAVQDIFFTATWYYKIKDILTPLPAQGTKIPIYAHVATMTPDWSAYEPVQDFVYNADMDPQFSNPANVQYGSNNFNIARLNFVLAQMDISKSLVGSSATSVSPNDTISYKVTPVIFGSQTAVNGTTFTIEDEIPADKNGVPVATYVPNSTVIEGSNGTYVGPTTGSCTNNPAKTCLIWTLTNVTSNQTVSSITYSLKADSDLSNLPESNSVYTFSNTVHILSSSTAINEASDTNLSEVGIQYPKSEVTLNLNVQGGYNIGKSLSTTASINKKTYPINNPDSVNNYPTFVLKYKNNRNLDLTNVAIIDILPYNGDNIVGNRSNTFEPTSTTASKYTNNSESGFVGLAAKPTIPAGSSIQYVIYDPANSATYPQNIKQDPCHVSNIPAGLDPGSNQPEAAGHYCRLLRLNGELLPRDGAEGADGTTGTGTTPWTNIEPADFSKVVAFRVITPTLPLSTEKKIVYQVRPQGNESGDVYCNTFGSRNFEISLDVRSNSACARVEGVDLELNKTIDGSGDGVYNKSESIDVGKNFTYRIELTNTTGVTATNVVVEDTLPEGVSVVSATLDDPSNSSVNIYSGKIEWLIDSVNVGDIRVLLIEAVLKPENLDVFKEKLIQNGQNRNLAEVKSMNQNDLDSTPGNIEDPFDPSTSEDDEGYADTHLPLTLGDTVWNDENADGRQNSKEKGIEGVKVTLFNDSDGNGIFDASVDKEIASTVTDENGKYLFTRLAQGNYFVVISTDQFESGKLRGFKVSANRTADPNDDVDMVNDGILLDRYITTDKPIKLTYGDEPENGGFGNRTVDFGFYYTKQPNLPKTGASTVISLLSTTLTMLGSSILFVNSKRKKEGK